MSDKIDQNNKQIVASKKRIENLQNQVNDKDTQLEKLKQEIARLQREKLNIIKKQNAEKRKNRTRAMIIFAGNILKLFPKYETAEKEIYTLGEYQELYNELIVQIKNSNIAFNAKPNITPADCNTLVIADNGDQLVIPNDNELKAITVSPKQKALLVQAWGFLKDLFSKQSTQYSQQQITERIMYYVNSESPSTIIDDYKAMIDKDSPTIDVLMSLH